MKKSAVFPIAVLCIALIANMFCCTVPAVNYSKTLVDKIGLMSGNGEIRYANGATVDDSGNWHFSYNGKSYSSEYDRLLAEDGFVYGMDWDWFGSFQEGEACLGDDQITGYPSAYREAYVRRALYNIKAFGFNAVSVWIGPHGAFTYDESGLVNGLDETFEKNLKSILNSFRMLNLDFVPALLTHGNSTDYNRNGTQLGGQQYMKYYRYYYEDEARDALIANGIDKICEILSGYQDVIPWIALTIENGSITNDINTGMMYSNDYAPTWEGFALLQNAMHDSVKKYMPKMQTSCEDVGWEDNQFKYNDLKVDIIARQQYQPNAQLQDIDICYTTRPCYVGEFNSSEIREIYEHLSDDYYTSLMPKFFPNLIKQGYFGAFQFQFNTSFEYWSLYYDRASADNYAKLKNYVIPMSYSIIDCKNEYKGTKTADKPVLLYNNGSNVLYWIGGRDTSSFTLERSVNGGAWEIVGENINVYDNMLSNGLICYTDSTMKLGDTYRYRVRAFHSNGEITVSEPGNEFERYNAPELFVDSDGQYTGGFEQADLTGDRSLKNSNGWYNIAWQTIGEFTDKTARSGKYSLHIDTANGIGYNNDYSAQWGYKILLSPRTTYTLSYYSKGSGGYFSVSTHDIADGDEITLSWGSPSGSNPEAPDEWQYNESTFTTGATGETMIKLMNMKNDEDIEVFLDDFSIKEDR